VPFPGGHYPLPENNLQVPAGGTVSLFFFFWDRTANSLISKRKGELLQIVYVPVIIMLPWKDLTFCTSITFRISYGYLPFMKNTMC
jgi:hypothetical protein